MNKSHCCNDDLIYLGKETKNSIFKFLDGVYLYACSKCGNIEWSTDKLKVKYKWYKLDERTKNFIGSKITKVGE